jgi:hypothetical protein
MDTDIMDITITDMTTDMTTDTTTDTTALLLFTLPMLAQPMVAQ